jgi:hypothetical protein
MTKGRIVSRTEVSCATTVRADSIVPQQHVITIHTIDDNSHSARIGRHSRKTKGKTYSSPRILLGPMLDQFIGSRCRVFKARGSVTGQFWHLNDKDLLIVVLLP